MELSRQATIDAYQKGAVSRFINHSCEPNAETQKWTVNGLLRIGFFAIRDIHPGEEITFDYQFIHFGQGQKCLCGAPSCRGIIGREADRIPAPRKAGDKEEDENYGKLILSTILTFRFPFFTNFLIRYKEGRLLRRYGETC